MWIATTVVEARGKRREESGTAALIPTMGALHEGHLRLIEAGRERADHVHVSLFVNPTQFGPGEDYDHYPRMPERDLAACERAGAAGVFAPPVEQMYPEAVPAVRMDVPELTADLEGADRPDHFAGVCRVVAKLLNILRPDWAVFGHKDYQQWKAIEAMTRDLMMPTAVLPVPTAREEDGLAISSRNQYLSRSQRPHALGLIKALTQARMLVEESGETDPAAVEEAMEAVLHAHHLRVDYAVIRHPDTLQPLQCIEPNLTGGVVALIAASLGSIRLIDNMRLGT